MKRKNLTTLLLFFILTIYISGCKSKAFYIPVESTKTEYVNVIQRDSIHLYDSIFIKEKNDTVFYTKYKYLYQNKFRTDTIIKIDSIQIPYPVVESVEVNKLTWYQKGCIWFTAIIFSGLFIYLSIRYFRFRTR